MFFVFGSPAFAAVVYDIGGSKYPTMDAACSSALASAGPGYQLTRIDSPAGSDPRYTCVYSHLVDGTWYVSGGTYINASCSAGDKQSLSIGIGYSTVSTSDSYFSPAGPYNIHGSVCFNSCTYAIDGVSTGLFVSTTP